MEINRINNTDDTEDSKVLRTAALLYGITYEDILALPLNETQRLVEGTAFLYTAPELHRPKNVIEVNGRRYRTMKDVSDMTTAQYIDFQSIATNLNNNLPQLMSIFLIPEGRKYNDGYSVSELAEEFRKYLTVEETVSLADFFMKKYVRLIRRSLMYLEAEVRTLEILTPKKDSLRTVLKEMKELVQKEKILTEMMEVQRCTFGLG